MPKKHNNFDFNTISDVLINVKYTAREGGERLKDAAEISLEDWLKGIKDSQISEGEPGIARLFSSKHELSSQFYKFLHPKDSNSVQRLDLDLTSIRFPFLNDSNKKLKIKAISVFFKLKEDYKKLQPLKISLIKADGKTAEKNDLKVIEWPTMPYLDHSFATETAELGNWTIEIEREKDKNEIPQWLRQKAENGMDDEVVVNKSNNKNYVRLNTDKIEDVIILCRCLEENTQ